MQIFIFGDSTAASYDPKETLMVGWGQRLGSYLPGCTVVNLAKAGRSTKTFLGEHRLDPADASARPGDLMLIQFAHNDENEKKPERYVTPAQFRENLILFVNFARRHQAVPVLLTPICMRIWENGVLQPTHGDYPRVMRDLAAELDLPLIDLYGESFRIVSGLGEESSKALFMQIPQGLDPRYPEALDDNAHTRFEGADRFAAFVAGELTGRLKLVP